MASPCRYNLDNTNETPIYQGETFLLSVTANAAGSPMDLTGYQAKSQIRESFQAIQPALTFSVSSGLGPNGVIALSASTSETLSLTVNKNYVWDLIIWNANTTTPLMTGTVAVLPRVTRL